MYNPYQYVPGSSLLHRLDPRTKVIVVIAFSVAIMQADLLYLLAAGTLIALVWLLAKIPVAMMLKTLRPVMPFFLLLFLIYVFFTAGAPIILIGPVSITFEGLAVGILQVGKFVLLVLAASLLTMSTNVTALTMGLERLLRPVNKMGGSSYEVAMMVILALRFFPVLMEEMNNIQDAQLSRNSNISSVRLSGRIRSAVYLALPLALSFLRRGDELADAMEARGYVPGPKTSLYELSLAMVDYIVTAMVIVTMVIYMSWL